jgi:hypothetical protein
VPTRYGVGPQAMEYNDEYYSATEERAVTSVDSVFDTMHAAQAEADRLTANAIRNGEYMYDYCFEDEDVDIKTSSDEELLQMRERRHRAYGDAPSAYVMISIDG